ncbi:hypothetical protein [Streptomyces pactum]|nr:hypothetical protein [Streptomyces pactum]
MSDDYAATLTTVNAAVLLVGTVQYTGLSRRVGDRVFSSEREQAAAKGHLIEQRRQGVEPSPGALVQLRSQRRDLRRRTSANLVAGSVWCVVCVLLIVHQLQILAWAGTADAEPDPGLARRCFLATCAGIVLLVLEPVARGSYRLWRGARKGPLEYTTRYTRQERRRLDRQIRTAAVQPPAPGTAPEPGGSAPRVPPSSPGAGR